MLRFIALLFLAASCSLGTVQKGGERKYAYDIQKDYSIAELKEASADMVVTSFRDPHDAKIDDLFSSKQRDLKRIGIVVFETNIQATRDGLASHDLIYPTEQGKQLMTERFLNVWEESFGLATKEIDYVPSSKIKKAAAMQQHGLEVVDYVQAKRKNQSLAPDDIFYLASGKKTATWTVFNPRGMRDLSFLLIPASELMSGPKWSEHHKVLLNQLARELNLDAVLVVMSEVNWTAHHQDKRSGETIPEELKVKIKTSTLIPMNQYQERLKALGKDGPYLNICYRSYEAEHRVPLTITAVPDDQNFETVEKNLLNPLFKLYRDLTLMSVIQITEDMKKTF